MNVWLDTNASTGLLTTLHVVITIMVNGALVPALDTAGYVIRWYRACTLLGWNVENAKHDCSWTSLIRTPIWATGQLVTVTRFAYHRCHGKSFDRIRGLSKQNHPKGWSSLCLTNKIEQGLFVFRSVVNYAMNKGRHEISKVRNTYRGPGFARLRNVCMIKLLQNSLLTAHPEERICRFRIPNKTCLNWAKYLKKSLSNVCITIQLTCYCKNVKENPLLPLGMM